MTETDRTRLGHAEALDYVAEVLRDAPLEHLEDKRQKLAAVIFNGAEEFRRIAREAATPAEPRVVTLGVIEFHPNAALRERFYAVRDDLTAAGCIVDLWLMDIASVLKEHGYQMTITTEKPLPVPAWMRSEAAALPPAEEPPP